MNWAVFQTVGFRLSGEDNTNNKVILFTCTSISLHPSEAEIRVQLKMGPCSAMKCLATVMEISPVLVMSYILSVRQKPLMKQFSFNHFLQCHCCGVFPLFSYNFTSSVLASQHKTAKGHSVITFRGNLYKVNEIMLGVLSNLLFLVSMHFISTCFAKFLNYL